MDSLSSEEILLLLCKVAMSESEFRKSTQRTHFWHNSLDCNIWKVWEERSLEEWSWEETVSYQKQPASWRIKPQTDQTQPWYLTSCSRFNPCSLLILPSLHLSISHSQFHFTPSKPSQSSFNTPSPSSHVSLPVFLCLPALLPALPHCKSHSCLRTFGETLQTCLFCFLFTKKPQPLSPDEMFYICPFKGKQFPEIPDRDGCQLSPRTFASTENVIHQPGCVVQLGNVTDLTVLWCLSCPGKSLTAVNQS